MEGRNKANFFSEVLLQTRLVIDILAKINRRSVSSLKPLSPFPSVKTIQTSSRSTFFSTTTSDDVYFLKSLPWIILRLCKVPNSLFLKREKGRLVKDKICLQGLIK